MYQCTCITFDKKDKWLNDYLFSCQCLTEFKPMRKELPPVCLCLVHCSTAALHSQASVTPAWLCSAAVVLSPASVKPAAKKAGLCTAAVKQQFFSYMPVKVTINVKTINAAEHCCWYQNVRGIAAHTAAAACNHQY